VTDSYRSWQEQSPLAEAQRSVEKANHATKQAMSHPSGQMVDQANQAIGKAARATLDAQDDGNEKAVSELNEALYRVQSERQQIEDNHK